MEGGGGGGGLLHFDVQQTQLARTAKIRPQMAYQITLPWEQRWDAQSCTYRW